MLKIREEGTGMTTPAEIIRQAKTKAERALMEVCSSEISRICEAFSYDTGIPVERVSFNFLEIQTVGKVSYEFESVLSGCSISIDTSF